MSRENFNKKLYKNLHVQFNKESNMDYHDDKISAHPGNIKTKERTESQ